MFRALAIGLLAAACAQPADPVVVTVDFPAAGMVADGTRLYGLGQDGVYWVSRDGGETTHGARFAGGNICDSGTLSFTVAPGAVVWAWSEAAFDMDSQMCLETISTIERVPIDAADPEVLATTPGVVVAMAADSTHVYWAGSDHVSRVAIGGGATEIVLDEVRPLALVLDDALLVKDARGDAILQVDPDTGAVATVARLGIAPENDSLLADATAVYWIEGRQINRSARDGGEPSVVAKLEQPAATVVVDGNHLLYTALEDSTWGLWRVPTDGGDDPARISLYGGALALDEDFLYVGSPRGILRFDRGADLPLDPPGDPDGFHPPFL
jgi:hypothetical protein